MKYKLTKEDLKKRLEIMSITKIARSENVSYGTIRNWAINYGLIKNEKSNKNL